MMREKKIGRWIILVAFWMIICISRIIWFFAEKNVDVENYENRQLTAKPTLSLDNYDTFPAEYTAYFNDNIQFRNSLITLNSIIDYFIFGVSSNEQVIVGDENWLFYSRVDDGDPISCYNGSNLYSEEELSLFAKHCIEQRDFLEQQGKEFVIFIAPNKERIYSEYMPEMYGEPALNYRALQVYNYLKTNTDLRVLYPYAELMESKKKLDANIYYKTDTHWNAVGGYIGATVLLDELGIEFPKIYDEEIYINEKSNYAGDLAALLNLNKQLTFSDVEYSVKGYNNHSVEFVEGSTHEAFIFRALNADSRKLYVIRDSFGEALAPYIGSQFNNSYFRHRDSYTYENLVSQNPDIVVYETVERSVGVLMDFSFY